MTDSQIYELLNLTVLFLLIIASAGLILGCLSILEKKIKNTKKKEI